MVLPMAVWQNERSQEFRLDKHVSFEHGYPCRLLSIDGTKCRSVLLEDISEGGAKLTVFGAVEDFDFSEFFLVFSSWATAHRRCTCVWRNDKQVGVEFLRHKATQPRARKLPAR
jgi:PilZ domain